MKPRPLRGDKLRMSAKQQSQNATGTKTRGYFAIGAERISKQLNVGNMVRSAHAFGASFVFTIGAEYSGEEAHADTSKNAVARAAVSLAER